MSRSADDQPLVFDADAVYRVNAPAVVSEAIDDEVIIIDLESGTYYTLGGSGPIAWEALEVGAALGELVAYVAARCADADEAKVALTIEEFLANVLEEGLVAPVEGGEREALIEQGAGSATFEPPVLERYIDMQALIQLDPVLEVDEQGYPRTGEV